MIPTRQMTFLRYKCLKSQISSGVHWREHNREHTDLVEFIQRKNRFKNVNLWDIDQGNSWLLLAYNKVPFRSSVVFFHYNFFHSTPLGTDLLNCLYVHWYWSKFEVWKWVQLLPAIFVWPKTALVSWCLFWRRLLRHFSVNF